MLIEILVSALILTVASAAVVTVLAASVGTAGEQRHGSEAYALAQQDQSRLATMRLGRLNHLEENRPITLNGTTFEVHSAGLWINNESGKQLCTGTAASSTDYVQLTSEVTWPGMDAAEKAKIMSILSPSGSQSVDTSLGKLPIKVSNELGEPVPGVVLTGSQIEGVGGHFSGKSDSGGCATFPELAVTNASGKPARNYSVVADGSQAGVINKDGKSSETVTGAAAAPSELPKILSFRFDHPGTIPVKFKYRVGSTATFEPATAESLTFINTGLTVSRVFWTTSGLREATVSASNLFPFSSPYSVFAGSCEGNKPKEGEAAMASAVAPAGGTAAPATIQLPALNLTVLNGTVPFKGAKVTITDKVCKDSKGATLKQTYTTNATGNQAATAEGPTEPWLPYGTYEICASGELKAGESKKVIITSLPVQSLTSATTQEINLAKGTTGVCT